MNNVRLLIKNIHKVARRRASEADVIVSITSFPERIKTIHIVILSLLKQTIRPKRICLFLANEELNESALPRPLRTLESLGIVEIIRTDKNYRSFNKLIHAKRLYPSSRIVTVDDDIHYPKKMIESLLRASDKDNASVITGLGRCIMIDENNSILPFCTWPTCSELKGHQIMQLGVCGVLYPPDCLHDDFDRSDLFEMLAPGNDDHWFKMMAFLKGVQVHSLGLASQSFEPLYIVNNRELRFQNLGRYDTTFVNLCRHYEISPTQFRNLSYTPRAQGQT